MAYLVEHIAQELKAERRKQGLSQKALGAKVGMPQSHISKIESGAVDLQTSSLIELARALDLELTLVSRTLVPVVKGLQRSRTVRANAPSRGAAEELVKDLEKIRKIAQRFSRSFPDTKEFQKLTASINNLENFRLGVSEAERAKKIIENLTGPLKLIKSMQSAENVSKGLQQKVDKINLIAGNQEFLKSVNQIVRATRDLGSLRTSLTSGLTPSAPVSLPASYLTEEENDA